MNVQFSWEYTSKGELSQIIRLACNDRSTEFHQTDFGALNKALRVWFGYLAADGPVKLISVDFNVDVDRPSPQNDLLVDGRCTSAWKSCLSGTIECDIRNQQPVAGKIFKQLELEQVGS